MARSPFAGDIVPGRIPWFRRGRPTAPYPHLANFRWPLRILEAVYWGSENEAVDARNNRWLRPVGMDAVLITRDPAVMKAILLATGDKPGQFDRDTWPTSGIARATGADSMLYANGPGWRSQKKLAAPAMSQTTLFSPERFHEFEATFRATVANRLKALRARQSETGESSLVVQVEPEISALMLEMLVNNFFGASVSYEELRSRYVPAIHGLIRRMVRDTVGFRFLYVFGSPARRRQIKAWRDDFEDLTSKALAGRKTGAGSWSDFNSEAPDEALRANIRVFLAGALEATTSMTAWALTHLARRPDVQDQVYAEIRGLDVYNPDNLAQAVTLRRVLEETLRLTPALYFLPRRASADTWVETADKKRLMIPKGTHVALDVWHANRREDVWGKEVTGFPAMTFEPERWERLAQAGISMNEMLHFGFGHGARVCPGRFLGMLEVGLVVGAFVKLFRFEAEGAIEASAGVSTKPADGTVLRLTLRQT